MVWGIFINGEDLRLVLIPENKNRDFFMLEEVFGENLSFTGANISDDHSNWCCSISPTAADVAGFAFQAATGFWFSYNRTKVLLEDAFNVCNCTNYVKKY